MTDRDYQQKLEQLDRLLNDPDVTMEPNLVWSLLAEVSRNEAAGAAWAIDNAIPLRRAETQPVVRT